VAKLFVECIVAPGYEPAALEKFCGEEKPAAAASPGMGKRRAEFDLELKRVSGGILVQEQDRHDLAEGELKVVTRRAPTREENRGPAFWLESLQAREINAIVFARAGQTVGIGAGQMSRVDSVKIAVMKAQLPLAEASSLRTHSFLSPMVWRKRERPVQPP